MSRRVGLSSHQKPPPLLKTIGQQPRVKKIKLPEAIDAPPVSSDDEDEGNLDGDENVGQARSASDQLIDKRRASPTLPHSTRNDNQSLLDSSDDSDFGRTTRATIKPTAFGQRTGKIQEESSVFKQKGKRKSSSSFAARNKRRGVNESNAVAEAESIPDKVHSKNPQSSSGSHESSDQIFAKAKSVTATYGKSKASGRRSQIKAPPTLDSPEKPKRGKLIVPTDDLPASPLSGDRMERVLKGEEEDSELDSPPPVRREISSHLRNRKGKKHGKVKHTTKSPTPPKAIFKMPSDISTFDYDGVKNNGDSEVVALDYESSSDNQPEAQEGEVTASKEDSTQLCPWCGQPVDELFFKEFSKGRRLNIRMQKIFCQKHRKRTAEDTWQERQYPVIDWSTLATRFPKERGLLLSIVNGQRSHFRTILAQKVETGTARALKQEDDLNPGYYGPRGFNLMCDYLVAEFGDLLKERAIHDRVIAGRGSAAFIQLVLVAELATQLIKEDMKVSEEEARNIMEQSKELGEIMHEE